MCTHLPCTSEDLLAWTHWSAGSLKLTLQNPVRKGEVVDGQVPSGTPVLVYFFDLHTLLRHPDGFLGLPVVPFSPLFCGRVPLLK